jgi:type IV pilus assembly protein PilB
MALARIQTSIVNNLKGLGVLDEDKARKLIFGEDMAGEALEKLLLSDYKVSEFQLLAAKGRAFGINPLNSKGLNANDQTYAILDKDFCRENRVFPLGSVGNHVVVAIANPFNLAVTQRISDLTRRPVSLILVSDRDINTALEEKKEQEQVHFGEVVKQLEGNFDPDEIKALESEDTAEESAPIIALANRIIEDAYFSGASDIHIEPMEKVGRIRVRIDGVCREKLTIPAKACSALLARIKVMSNLDISEKRLPQDGRIVFKQFNRRGLDLDLRVSTAPLNFGEGAVMRILDKQKSTLPLPALGFEPENLELYRDLIQRPYGMILHCGPTGSGKSMTLYSALNEINSPEICIRTAEDPIEYTLPGLCQMQMHRKIGLTFASALRSFLRQDPDVVLVGEIRDSETAGIAIEAALTGHLLFSTLHTNDAPSTVARLTDMGIEPFMISASLVCVCAQRLMRRVCKSCKQPYQPEGRELEIIRRAIGHEGQAFRANPDGCPACGGLGYKGRVGIHELMSVSEGLIEGINKQIETAELKKIAMYTGMSTLHQDSMRKVRSGLSTIQECIATVPPDLEDLESLKEEFALKTRVKHQDDLDRKSKLEALRKSQDEPGA